MALPVSTLDPAAKDLQKRKTQTNLPQAIPGKSTPFSALAAPTPGLQQTAQPPAPAGTVAPTSASQPAGAVAPQAQTFTTEQAAALAGAQPPPAPTTPVAPPTTEQVLGQAQNLALKGFQSPLQEQQQALIQQFLADPNLGRNPERAKQLALEEFDKRQAQGIESFRQQTGGIAGSGQRNEEFLRQLLEGGQDRTRLGVQIDLQENETRRQNLIQALAVGAQGIEQQQAIQTGDINNLINAAGGALGFAELAVRENVLLSQNEFIGAQAALQQEHETAMQEGRIDAARDTLAKQLEFETHQATLGREFTAEQNGFNRTLKESLAHLDINAQREFINLKALIDSDKLLSQQDFVKTQAELDRSLEEALQTGNTEAAIALQLSQQQFTAIQAEADRRQQTAERMAIQDFNRDEGRTEREWKDAFQAVENNQQLAIQENDILAQNSWEDARNKLQLDLVTANQTADEALLTLGADLEEAKADNDVERQKILLDYTANLEFEKIVNEAGIATAMANLQGKIQQELDDNNSANALLLQKQVLNQQWKIHSQNFTLAQIQQEMEKAGLDYSQIQQAVANGQISPDAAVEQLMSTLPPDVAANITLPDPNAQQQALQEDFLMQQYQFALSHPGSGLFVDGDGNPVAEGTEGAQFSGLKEEYNEQFSGIINNTIFGTDETPAGQLLADLKSGDENVVSFFTGKSASDPVYKELMNDNSTKVWSRKTQKIGNASTARNIYANMPGVGGFIKNGDSLFQLSAKKTDDKPGVDDKQYKLTNVLTGDSFWISTEDPNGTYKIFDKNMNP